MIQIQQFYRRFGVLRPTDLACPELHYIKTLELPLDTTYHYLAYDGSVTGPANDEPLFRTVKHAIPLKHIVSLIGIKGPPRALAFNFEDAITGFHSTHRKFRRARVIEPVLGDHQTPIVFNYCLLGKAYTYQQNAYSNYNRISNIWQTLVDSIATQVQSNNRNHFVTIGLPRLLPTLKTIQDSIDEVDTVRVKSFNDPNSFVLLELARVIIGRAEDTMFSAIPKDKWNKVNFLVVDGDHWFCLNLGHLLSWKRLVKPSPQEQQDFDNNPVKSRNTLAPRDLLVRLIRSYLTLQETRLAALTKTNDQPIASLVETSEETPNEPTDKQEAVIETTTTQELKNLSQVSIDDLEDEEVEQLVGEQNKLIELDIEKLEELGALSFNNNKASLPVSDILKEQSDDALDANILEQLDKLAADGLLTPAELKRRQRQASMYRDLLWGNTDEKIADYIKIDPNKQLIDQGPKFKDSNDIHDKSMLRCSLEDFGPKYINEFLSKDTAGCAMAIMRAGVSVTGYRVNVNEDAMGAHEEHTIKISPIVGVPSTLRFKVPVINEDGTFVSNGVKYRLKTQRGDIPIRKTAPNEVALSSFYGKLFVIRGRTNSVNYAHWISDKMSAKLIDSRPNNPFSNPAFGNCEDQDLKCSEVYSGIATTISAFDYSGYRFHFSQKEMEKAVGAETFARLKTTNRLPIGHGQTGFILLDNEGIVYEYREGVETSLGRFDEYLKLPVSTAPNEYISVGLFGKYVPLGVMLGMKMGLSNLISSLGVTPRVVPAGKRLNLGIREYALTFSDESYVFSKDDRMASLILSGFDSYWKSLRSYSVLSFDQPGAYVNLLENNGLSVRYSREIDLLFQMFVDPVTKDLLTQMNEPTTFRGLLFRSAELLMDDRYKDELDGAYLRLKGYDRIAAAVYAEMVISLRTHNGRLGKNNAPIEMHPYAVWKRIVEDPSKIQVQEINPIKQLKEQEAVTYAGVGGRSKRAMTKNTRRYHPNDMGTISESTVDSSDVGINLHMSANPKLISIRGLTSRYDFDKDGPASLLSTSALLAPGSDRDDPKRVNFIAIQQEHAVACPAYHKPSLRTGCEKLVGDRTTSLFCKTAKKPGKVRSITKHGIIVDYADGTSQGYELGRYFGNAAGLTIAHEIVTDLKEGDTIEFGDTIAYNTGFFEKDIWEPKRPILKNAVEVPTVFWESSDTHEDGSSISRLLISKLSTKTTKVKTIVVRFDQVVHNLVETGSQVDADQVLCYIEDPVTAGMGAFDEQSVETLRMVSAHSPKANVRGIVERIEVFYHGDKEDMHESLQSLCTASDRERKQRALSVDKKPFTGKVDGAFRIEGSPLNLDTLAIRVYITSDVNYGIGDKGVVGNQLKTVTGAIFDGEMKTESGMQILATFGGKSVEARIVNAALLQAGMITCLRLGGTKMAAIYRGTKK
jgi:hypothetical protein